jgi:hypothetical protein
MTNEEAVQLIKNQFTSISGRVLKAAILTTPLSFLETPPLSFITNKIIDWATGVLAKDGEIGAFFLYTNFNVNQQGADFMKAVIENQRMQQMGSEDDKKISEQKLKDAFARLIVLSN